MECTNIQPNQIETEFSKRVNEKNPQNISIVKQSLEVHHVSHNDVKNWGYGMKLLQWRSKGKCSLSSFLLFFCKI